jgi:hypothetical protein
MEGWGGSFDGGDDDEDGTEFVVRYARRPQRVYPIMESELEMIESGSRWARRRLVARIRSESRFDDDAGANTPDGRRMAET